MKPDRLNALLAKYAAQTLSDEERLELYNWYNEQGKKSNLQEPDLTDMNSRLDRVAVNVLKPTDAIKAKPKRWLWSAAAAIALLGVGISWWEFRGGDAVENRIVWADTAAAVQLFSGVNEPVRLNELSVNDTIDNLGTKVFRSTDGFIVFSKTTVDLPKEDNQHVRTPKGVSSKLLLPDGTKVWLNSESEIIFPLDMGIASRKVKIKGEVYFEVAKLAGHGVDKWKNFIVESDRQEVEVLGTKFNVLSYDNDELLTTTLDEGSIRLKTFDANRRPRQSFLLKPGQQSILNKLVDKVDFKNLGADVPSNWRDGYFTFSGESLREVCTQLERWYPVTFDLADNLPTGEYHGDIPKSYSLNEVMNILIQDKLRYKILDGNNGIRIQLTIN